MTAPAGGGKDDPFASRFLLGPPVEAETSTLDGERVVHELALSDMTGEGPTLCDRTSPLAGSGGGCTGRDPGADDASVAFDWLSGTSGSGDIRGVTAAVDERVAKVRIWMDNGDMTLATLHPTG